MRGSTAYNGFNPLAGKISDQFNQPPLYVRRTNLSGGQNTRINSANLPEDELQFAYSLDLGIPGQTDKRQGLTLIANTVGARTYALSPYYATGSSGELYRVEGTNVREWTGSGNWSSALYSALTSGQDMCIIQGGESGNNEVLFFNNGTDNPLRMNSSHTFQDLGSGSTSPPKSSINLWFNNRWWILKNGFLYYSDAYSSNYSTAFQASNGFRFSGFGADRGLFSVRDVSTVFAGTIIVFLQKAIWGIAPSATPASTDLPFPFTTEFGAVERKCIAQMGDDVAFLAPDGIRSLKRTVQDKMAVATSYPLSFRLKDEYDNIDWSQSNKFWMMYWKDKLFFSFVSKPGTECNRAWVYWPSLDDGTGKGWSVVNSGWNLTAGCKFILNGQELAYAADANGNVFQLWMGGDDNGVAITNQVTTREEDLGRPDVYKYGGEFELVCVATGNYNMAVQAAIDGGAFTTLEESPLNLLSNSPSLPVNLPFNLESASRVSKKFHLDPLGRWRRIQFQITNSDSNGSDVIRILEYSIATFPEQYQSNA